MTEKGLGQILREAYPERQRQSEILRFAQDDSERAQDDSLEDLVCFLRLCK
jgi:hypothetical protein